LKNRHKKIFLLLFVLLFTFYSACSNAELPSTDNSSASLEPPRQTSANQEKKPETELDTSAMPSEAEPSPIINQEEIYEAYQEILDVLYYGSLDRWSTYNLEEQEQLDKIMSYLWYQYPAQSLSDVGYTLIDLNDDSIPELLTGGILEADQGMFYNLYTYLNGSVSLVASSGERDRFYLYADQIIANEGSAGAADSYIGFFTLEKGSKDLTLKESVRLYEMMDSLEGPWFYGTTDAHNIEEMEAISEQKASEIISKYEPVPIQLTPLDQYTPKDSNQHSTSSAPSSASSGTSQSATPSKAPDLLPIDYVGMTVNNLTELWGEDYQIGEDWFLGAAKPFYYSDLRIPLRFYFIDSDYSSIVHGDSIISMVEFSHNIESTFNELAPGISVDITYDQLISLGYEGTLFEGSDFMQALGETALFLTEYNDNIELSFYWFNNVDPHIAPAGTVFIQSKP